MVRPLELVQDFILALLALVLRIFNYPYIFQSWSNDFVIDQQGFIKITKRVLVSYLIGFMVFSGTGLLFLFNPFGTKEAAAVWFNDNWAYRKAYTLPTHSASEDNVYVTLSIDTAALVTAGKMQSDCDDSRFTQQNGEILAYYIVSGCNTSTTSINVNFKTYPAGIVTIYFYYGNPSAVSGASDSNFSTGASNNSSPTTLNLQIAASADDVNAQSISNDSGRNVTSGTIGSLTVTLFSPGSHGSNDEYSSGARFNSVTIPQGSTVTAATFTLTPQATYSSAATISYLVSGEAADNAGIYQDNGSPGGCLRISGCLLSMTNRPRTTAVSSAWNQNSVTADSAQSIDVTSVVQEVINRAGWASGNNLNILVDTNTTTTQSEWQDYCSWDNVTAPCNSDHTDAPKLSITYGTAFSPTIGSEEAGPSPTLYWKFDDPAVSSVIQDSTTNGLNGTLNNAPAWQTEDQCISGKCFYFSLNGNKSISKTDDDKLDFAASDNFSVSLWMKHPGPIAGTQNILSKATGSPYAGYKIYMDASGDLCFDTRDGVHGTDTACTSAVDFDDDNWHYVTGVKNGTTSITLYVDGKQRAQDSSIVSTGSLANSGTFYVGIDQDGTSNDWLGFIDEVKVARDQTARTAAQVQADYNSRSNPEGISQQQGNNTQNLPAALSNGLVGYWKMNETATPSLDSSGNSSSGTWTGTTSSTGKFNNGNSFDGIDDKIQVTDANVLDATNVTLSAWIKATALGGVIIDKATGAAGTDGYYLDTSGSKIRFCATGGCVSSTTTLTTATWTHITVTWDGTTVRFFLNGALDGTSTGTVTSVATNAANLILGLDSASTGDYNGKIDEARVYNRALSGAEVSGLYNWAPGPAGYWKLDEGSGISAVDFSGNGNNGTLTNSPTRVQGKYGQALDFNSATSAHVPAGSGSSLNITSGYTLEAWVKPTSTDLAATWADVVSNYDSTGNTAQYELTFNSGVLTLGFGNSGFETYTTAATFTAGNWYHIVTTYDANHNAQFYVNGVFYTATRTFGGTITLPTSGFGNTTIGRAGDYDGQYFDGVIDEAKIYNYVRSASQVVEDMNAGHPAPGSPVGSAVGFWKFNEGADNTCSGGTNDVCNSGSIGNTIDGTLTASSRTTAGKFGGALDGATNRRAAVADNANLDFVAGEDLSISFWFKSDSATNPSANEYLVEKGGNITTDAIGYAIYTSAASDGLLCFGIDDDATTFPEDSVCSTTDVYDATWHYLLATKTGNTRLDLYIDGKPNGTPDTAISATGTLANAASFYIGDTNATDDTDEFLGDLDEVKVFRSALTQAQAQLDMNQSSSEVLGSLSSSQTNPNAAASEYCIPGDATTCTSPVGRWDFEEGSGTAANDQSGNGNTGTITAGTGGYATGKIGKSYNYDGTTTTNIAGTGTTVDNLPAAGMTLEAWVYPRTIGENNAGFILAKNNGTSQNAGWIFLGLGIGATNALQFVVDGSTDLVVTSSNNALTLNTWQHVALSWDGVMTTASSAHIYVNGKEVSYATQTNGASRVDDNASSFYIGNDSSSARTFNGYIDQARAFNYARSAAQITWDYNRGAPVAHWKMDECQGTTINDSSGNSNTGTMTGSSTVGTCSTSSTFWGGSGGTGAGKRNYAPTFNGTDDVIRRAETTTTDLGATTDSYSLGAWIKTSTTYSTNGFIIAKDVDGTAPYPYRLYIDTSQHACFDFKEGTNNSSICGASALNDGTWHHVVGIRDVPNDQLHLYVDGVKAATDTTDISTATVANNDDVSIGNGGATYTSNDFTGQIDDAKIYNYPLTAAQIKTLYNQAATNYGPVTGAP